MIDNGKKDDGVRHALANQINELTHYSDYYISSFQYDPLHFGNVVVELTDDNFLARFTFDRGDIFCKKKLLESTQWIDDQLVYSHSTPCNEVYELLLKAIRDFLNVV